LTGFHRVFVGIECDHRAQRRINDLLRPIRKSPLDIRWVPENNRHQTLAFLGDIPTPKLENLLGLFDATYQKVEQFQTRLTRLIRFPETNGRIIALINEPDSRLNFLFQTTLALLQNCHLELDRKTFRPHITLGRIKKAKQVETIFDQPTRIVLNIKSIRLYQSTLTECGSIYTVLKETHLTRNAVDFI
jgi:2'-5' RNA ligase